jgi:pyochelin synthetase
MSNITTEQFIGELAHAGLQLWEENGALRYSAPKGVLTPERREELISRKPQVLAYLRRRNAPERSHPPIYSDPEHRHDPFPITDLQSAYLIGRSGAFELGNTACHTYVEIDCPNLDLAHFGAIWRRLIERHDMLRSVFLHSGSKES